MIQQARSRTSNSLNIYKFPENVEAVPHKMLINIRSRVYNNRGGTLSASVSGGTIKNAVALPVPNEILESYAAGYQVTDLGVLGNTIADVAKGNFSGAGSTLTGNASSFRDSILNVGQGALFQSASAFASAVTPVGAAAVQAGAGMLFNPHQTSVFQGMNLQQKNYNWILSPKTKNESSNIEMIISILRNAMLPPRHRNTLFLEYPDEVEYKILGPKQEFSMPTTPCVIKNIVIDRAHMGPSFFAETGAPVVYKLTLTLLEIRALTRDDFLNNGTQSRNETSPIPNQPVNVR